MLIDKQNIKDITQFSLNIEDRMITPSINDAQEYDLRPLVGDLMYYEILSKFDGQIITIWDALTAYNINDYVFYDKIVYKSLTANVGSQPDINPTDFQANQLGTFYYNLLIPFLVFRCYARFLLWVGRNVTQYGLREMNEDTSVPVNEQGRADLIKDMNSKANICNSRFKNYLCDVNWTLDTIVYSVDCTDYANPRKSYNIRAIR
jgi:hypothetical protein